MTLLVMKLLLAPLLVVGSSLAGRRWGPALSGTLVALPLVAGPILLIIAIEHGGAFGARAASGSELGIAALALFVLVVGQASRRRAWPVALAAGWAAFLIAALLLALLAGVLAPSGLAPAVSFELVLAASAIALAAWMMPRVGGPRRGVSEPPAWDLPARAIATALLVLSITAAAATLGPTLTGVLTPFPVATSVLAAFVLAQEGPERANELLRGFLRGAFGFATFCFLLATLLTALGTLAAFGCALAGAFAAQLLALRFGLPSRMRAAGTIRRA